MNQMYTSHVDNKATVKDHQNRTAQNNEQRENLNVLDDTSQTNAAGNMSMSISSNRKAHISVAILCFINLINYMDRYTLAGVLTDVKNYYSLNQSEAGLLQTSFIVSYMITAPLFGYLGDRYSRRIIMACGIAFWSTTTFLGSCVPSGHFRWFVLLRALVGTGEASYSTIAPTIIADLYTNSARTRMLSLFYFAIPVGSGLGYIIGPQVANLVGHWYWALRVTPGLGILSVILCLIVLAEPPRGEAEGVICFKPTNVIQDIKEVLKIRSFLWVTFGFTCVSFSVGALAWWVPDFMTSAIEVNGGKADKTAVSLVFGVITCFAGICGVILGSITSQYFRKFNSSADPLICAYSMIAAVPLVFFACIYASTHLSLAYVLVFMGVTMLCMNYVIVTDIVLYVIIPQRRSMAQAIQITVSHAFGDACSPYLIGLIADASFHGDKSAMSRYISMEYALFLPIFILVIGASCFFMNSFYVFEDKENCRALSQGELFLAVGIPSCTSESFTEQNVNRNDSFDDSVNLID